MTRVLFYVQHLLGLGHGARSAAIVREARGVGLDVTYVSGGMPTETLDLAGARMVQFPPLRAADPSYAGLADSRGRPPDEALWNARQAVLMEAVDADRPDIVLVETFPFGRWPFRREILPMLDSVRGKARIVCSVRDILEPKPEDRRNDRIVELIERYCDLVLVHGDPNMVSLDRSFSRTGAIADRIRYTGYVAPPEAGRRSAGDEVIVSAGGGATCRALMTAARGAALLDNRPWRFLLGPNCPPDVRRQLAATNGIVAEPVRDDFRDILAGSALSISQAGYNTAMDVLAAGIPSVMVPFSGHGQTEQGVRARILSTRRRTVVVEETELTPAALLTAAAQAVCETGGPASGIDLGGARRSAEIVAGLSNCGDLWDSSATTDIKAP